MCTFCYQQIAVEIQTFVTYNWQIVQSLIMQIFVVSDFDLLANGQYHNIYIYTSTQCQCKARCLITGFPLHRSYGWHKWDNQIIFSRSVLTALFEVERAVECRDGFFIIIIIIIVVQWPMKRSCLISEFNRRDKCVRMRSTNKIHRSTSNKYETNANVMK